MASVQNTEEVHDEDKEKKAAQAMAPAEPEQAPEKYVSHFRNEAHSATLRYGIPLFLLSALILLINADIGSGVSAEYLLYYNGEIYEHRRLLMVSIFNSVSKLWGNGSYPLAILIAITSVAWPYVKLLLTFYAWMAPYKVPRRRELFIEIIDALDKWSFVDIMVLVEIVVAFRTDANLAPGVDLAIVIEAKWGFYGFVVASIMSLISTHVMLHYHRKLHYAHIHAQEHACVEAQSDTAGKDAPVSFKEKGGLSNRFMVLAFLGVVISVASYLVGCFVSIYRVYESRATGSIPKDYSIVSVGSAFPESQRNPQAAGIIFVQVMWFLLGVAMPVLCSVLFGVLYFVPLNKVWTERIFFFGEMSFAWSCAEVLLISTVVSVAQMPTFGDGLIQANCTACYEVDTEILPQLAFLVVGSVFNVAVNVWLFRKAHHVIFGVW
eukprot:Nitzschia sp. Nitz4//scaffold1_size375055//84702//86183//NITZ4_000233-RA/size375055-augustus-gene-0.663-mRNA-1//1//CDS//3329540916//6119//frame0